jgi:hypothetical protein
MANAARHLISGFAFMVTLFSAMQTLAFGDGQPTIVLHVFDYARISPADRSGAETEVTRIYAAAGVRTVWATGDEHADAPGLHVRVLLFSSDVVIRELRPESLPDNLLGLAARESGRAYIFIHRIATLALQRGDDFRLAFGRVMAHEVGHLLLPSDSHSDRGIMRAYVSVRSKDGRDFTTEQGVVIRAMLVAASRPHAVKTTDAAVNQETRHDPRIP